MRRFFILPEGVSDNRLHFTGSDSHYIVRVLRLKKFDRIMAFDSKANEYEAELIKVSPHSVEAKIIERRQVSPFRKYRIVLAAPLLKGKGTDLILRQSVEIGIDEFVPIIYERCVSLAGQGLSHKISRWEKVAVSAACQSGQPAPPRLYPVQSWDEFCQNQEATPGWKLMAWEQEKSRSLKSELKNYLSQGSPRKIVLALGPEGGFSPEEVKKALKIGFRTVTLGPSILRASTAPQVLLAGIHFFLEES